MKNPIHVKEFIKSLTLTGRHFMKSIPFLLVVLLLLCNSAGAQNSEICFGPGLSKDMRSGDNMWDLGFQIQASYFLKSSGKLWYGLRFAVNRWAYDESEYPLQSGYSIDKSEGNQTLIEIAPSIRYPLSSKTYLRLGAGLFLISESDIKLDLSFSTPSSYGEEHVTMEGGSATGFGLQPGIELALEPFSIVPIYTVYLRDSDIYHHIAVSVNLCINP